MYAEGIAYGLRSNYFWVVKKRHGRDSLKDATSARPACINRVSELEPNNVDARPRTKGCTITSSVACRWNYRMLGFMVGIHGDKVKGHPYRAGCRPPTASLNRMDATDSALRAFTVGRARPSRPSPSCRN